MCYEHEIIYFLKPLLAANNETEATNTFRKVHQTGQDNNEEFNTKSKGRSKFQHPKVRKMCRRKLFNIGVINSAAIKQHKTIAEKATQIIRLR